MWADCLHYFHRDIEDMDGASAMKLAERLRHVVDVYPPTEDEDGNRKLVFRSALFAAVDRDTSSFEAEEALEMDADTLAAELARIDPSGTVEVVAV